MIERHRHNGADIDRAIHRYPSPETVARLVASHGFDAAVARWWYLSDRTVGKLAQLGRGRIGDTAARGHGRAAASTLEDRAVAVEAGYALGSARRGERAAGLRLNAGRAAFEARGLDPVAISPDERGRMARLSARANGGDAEAAAAVEAQYALERAVAEVFRRALRLVPDQPATGRYAMPPRGPELDAALSGLDPLAIAIAFPAPVAEKRKPRKASTVDIADIHARWKAGTPPT